MKENRGPGPRSLLVGLSAVLVVAGVLVLTPAASAADQTDWEEIASPQLENALNFDSPYDAEPYVVDGKVQVMLVGPDIETPDDIDLDDREAWVDHFETAHQPFLEDVQALQDDHQFDIVANVPAANHVFIEAEVDEAKRVIEADEEMDTPFVAAHLDYEGAVELTGDDVGALGSGGNEESRAMINAQTFYDAGYTGDGVLYGHTDTGVDDSHPCFLDENGNSRVVAWDDQHNGRDEPYDDHGHGTHTLATATGSNSDACEESGVAYEADLVVSKVLSGFGSGSFSQVEAGLWFTYEQGAEVSSHSWGASPGCSSGAEQDLVDAIHQMVEGGYNVFFSAGNSGSAGIGCPADGAKVVSVGATDWDKTVASFSSRGPCTDGKICPDFSAVGVNLRSAAPGGGYTSFSGTSMSSPAAGGASGLIADATKDLLGRDLLPPGANPPAQDPLPEDITEVRRLMRTYAEDLGADGPDNDYGWGFVDLDPILDDILARSTGKATVNVTSPADEIPAETENPFTITVENVRPAIDTRGTFEYAFTDADGDTIEAGSQTLNLGDSYADNVLELTLPFDSARKAPGTYAVEASYQYEWTSPANGSVFEDSDADADSVTVIRPVLDVEHSVPDVLPGEPFQATVSFENSGNADALNVDLTPTIPSGETVRAEPTTETLDGYKWIGDPAPERVFVDTSTGEQWLVYDTFDVAAGETFTVTYNLAAGTPGELVHTAETSWTDYADVSYGEDFETPHTVGPAAGGAADLGTGTSTAVDLPPFVAAVPAFHG